MARKAVRIYVPLDVGFFDDDTTIAIGERPAWLYLAMLARIKQQDTDGLISRLQLGRLNIPDWRKRMVPLLEWGLVEQVSPETYRVPAWLKWNESRDERGERLARDRDRKAQSFRSESTRNPDGIRSNTSAESALSQNSQPASKNTTSVVPISTVSGGLARESTR